MFLLAPLSGALALLPVAAFVRFVRGASSGVRCRLVSMGVRRGALGELVPCESGDVRRPSIGKPELRRLSGRERRLVCESALVCTSGFVLSPYVSPHLNCSPRRHEVEMVSFLKSWLTIHVQNFL